MTLLDDFAAGYPFGLDDFQVAGISALVEGRSALVAAPTGAGKTVVGEFAVWQALQRGGKCFYTTPIKAL
ncbi:MAG: DEAD/DEAH box helicase, partial [Euzebyaceae bacterium]|nr:DEAD/DEAH box helicase [Euzebyaceae bacterium]